MQTSERRKEVEVCKMSLLRVSLFQSASAENCTSPKGIGASQHVHVCALKGTEAMSERRKDSHLIRWSLIV